MRKHNWGYKGTLTSLNGLLNWMARNSKLNADEMLKEIVRYAQENIPGYKKYGHITTAADFIAKKIHRNDKFNHFTEWFKNKNTTHA